MKKYLSLLAMVVLMSGCHKNEATMSYSMTYIGDSIKSLAFLSGSYWIYLSDSLNKKDCTYIATTQSAFYEIVDAPEHTELYECFAMNCNSVHLPANSTSQYFIETNHMMLDAVIQFPSAQGPVLYTYDTLTDWKRTTSENRYLDSLQVGSKTFFNVQECKFLLTPYTYVYYTVAGIGIVKKVITGNSTSQSWNLTKWKTIK